MKLKKIWGRTTVSERFDHCETRESYYCSRSFKKMFHRTKDTEPMDRILLWAVESQSQLRSFSTELSSERHREWPPHPSQRSGGSSTIIEEREISWSRQHPSRTGPSNKIWQTGEWPPLWTRSLVITPPKKGNLQQCQNYPTISLISHPSKVILKIILNKLKPQAEKFIAEEQAGFRARRGTTVKIFNLRILCEKYLQHQQDLNHVFF